MRTFARYRYGWKRQAALMALLAFLGISGLPSEAQELVPTKPADQRQSLVNPLAGWGPDYTNWVDVSVGSLFVDGNHAEAMRRYQVPDTVFGGIESLHVEQPVGTNGLFQIDGRGIFDNHDYDLRLDYTRNNFGYIRGGFSESRDWYDRTGGFFPPTSLYLTPYGQDVAVDRGDAWVELGLRRPDVPELTLRYSHEFRSGTKDSTSWGDINTTAAGAPRSIVPSFYGLDEKRDTVQLSARHTIKDTELDGSLTYEHLQQNDQLFVLRQPGQASQRYLTQDNDMQSDLFNAHASAASQLSDRILLTSGYAFTLIDEDMSGSRVYGSGFDAVYDPTFRRQTFDEGFLNLDGTGTFHEHLFNLGLQYRPWDNFSITPAVRIARQDESAGSSWLDTDFASPGGGAPPVASSDPSLGSNDRDYTEVDESLELRYTGLTNWLLYARGEWDQDQGDLTQSQLDLITTNSDLLNVDANRFTQKYILGANWYPLRRLSLSGQYYHKIRDVTYENQLGAPPTSYPGFLQRQDFETDDGNVRLTVRPLNTLTLVTRYDFQLSTIDTAGDSLSSVQSARITSHIISQSVSWLPIPRLTLQASFDYVLDTTHTPANDLSGAAANLVLESQDGYYDVSVLAGFTIDDKTDLQLQYHYYRADDYQNNAAFSQPYGAGAEENGVTVTLIRKLSRSLRWTLKYGYFTNHDQTYGGNLDYQAHLIYSSLQYRF